MNAPLIQATELQQSLTFLEDQLEFWSFDLPHVCESKDEAVQAIWRGIKNRETWLLASNNEFEWNDYFLCRLQDGSIHPKHGMAFLNFLAGGSLRENVQYSIILKSEKVRALEAIGKWMPNIMGNNVKYMSKRLDEKGGEFVGDSIYEITWRKFIKQAKRVLSGYRGCESQQPSEALSRLLTTRQNMANNQKVFLGEFESFKEKIDTFEAKYLDVNPLIPELMPSANTYTGELFITIDIEAVKRWAGALNEGDNRGDLNQSVCQLLLEAGTLFRENCAFTESEASSIELQKNGFALGRAEYQVVCKTCRRTGGGNCPDCGTCAGYS